MSASFVSGVIALLYEKGSADTEAVRSAIKNGADQVSVAPIDSPTAIYSFDGVREGVLYDPGALGY